jgi:hypothetical protein
LPVVLVLLRFGGTTRGEEKPFPDDPARFEAKIKPSDRRHWSFQPVTQPPVPTVRGRGWVRSPIDAFVLARLEPKGWRPAPAAEPRALLRRVYLDLIGLPPTPAEQEAFLQNRSSDALDRVVEDLLARPAYGERWARHWLDLVRYAESNGYERDGAKPHVWRYRDYVIQAFNGDKPFDRFILEQLAGDELPDASAETLVATGYYRLGPWDDEPADPLTDRYDQLDDILQTTSQAFLGLTLGCARCHHHKFEPLSMQDYYRLVAVFNPLNRPQNGRTELDLPIGSRAELAALAERDRRIAELTRTALSQSAAAVGLASSPWTAPLAPRPAAEGRQRTEQIAGLRRAVPDLPRGYFLHEPSPNPPVTRLLIRGSAARPGPEVAPGLPTVLAPAQPVFPPPGERTSRRRWTLARWIASPDNPLTARVLVNRVWQFHFGEGLVRTPSDFGTMGQPPTHPELLDWLTNRFVQDGWSLKKLHRLILASSTYRMSKRANPAYLAEDPEDKLLWRVPYQRLEVEAIRDSMLAASGRLNPAMYGPSMYPEVPKQALEGHSDPDKIWHPSEEREASRRTIYAFVKRSLIVPMIETLDFCDTAHSTAKRVTTTVAPQALSLFNGDFVNRQARHLAERLEREAGNDPEEQIDLAYRLALGRPPTPAERTALRQFLQQESAGLLKESARTDHPVRPGEARRRALEQVCRVLFNSNEFVYAD